MEEKCRFCGVVNPENFYDVIETTLLKAWVKKHFKVDTADGNSKRLCQPCLQLTRKFIAFHATIQKSQRLLFPGPPFSVEAETQTEGVSSRNTGSQTPVSSLTDFIVNTPSTSSNEALPSSSTQSLINGSTSSLSSSSGRTRSRNSSSKSNASISTQTSASGRASRKRQFNVASDDEKDINYSPKNLRLSLTKRKSLRLCNRTPSPSRKTRSTSRSSKSDSEDNSDDNSEGRSRRTRRKSKKKVRYTGNSDSESEKSGNDSDFSPADVAASESDEPPSPTPSSNSSDSSSSDSESEKSSSPVVKATRRIVSSDEDDTEVSTGHPLNKSSSENSPINKETTVESIPITPQAVIEDPSINDENLACVMETEPELPPSEESEEQPEDIVMQDDTEQEEEDVINEPEFISLEQLTPSENQPDLSTGDEPIISVALPQNTGTDILSNDNETDVTDKNPKNVEKPVSKTVENVTSTSKTANISKETSNTTKNLSKLVENIPSTSMAVNINKEMPKSTENGSKEAENIPSTSKAVNTNKEMPKSTKNLSKEAENIPNTSKAVNINKEMPKSTENVSKEAENIPSTSKTTNISRETSKSTENITKNAENISNTSKTANINKEAPKTTERPTSVSKETSKTTEILPSTRKEAPKSVENIPSISKTTENTDVVTITTEPPSETRENTASKNTNNTNNQLPISSVQGSVKPKVGLVALSKLMSPSVPVQTKQLGQDIAAQIQARLRNNQEPIPSAVVIPNTARLSTLNVGNQTFARQPIDPNAPLNQAIVRPQTQKQVSLDPSVRASLTYEKAKVIRETPHFYRLSQEDQRLIINIISQHAQAPINIQSSEPSVTNQVCTPQVMNTSTVQNPVVFQFLQPNQQPTQQNIVTIPQQQSVVTQQFLTQPGQQLIFQTLVQQPVVTTSVVTQNPTMLHPSIVSQANPMVVQQQVIQQPPVAPVVVPSTPVPTPVVTRPQVQPCSMPELVDLEGPAVSHPGSATSSTTVESSKTIDARELPAEALAQLGLTLEGLSPGSPQHGSELNEPLSNVLSPSIDVPLSVTPPVVCSNTSNISTQVTNTIANSSTCNTVASNNSMLNVSTDITNNNVQLSGPVYTNASTITTLAQNSTRLSHTMQGNVSQSQNTNYVNSQLETAQNSKVSSNSVNQLPVLKQLLQHRSSTVLNEQRTSPDQQYQPTHTTSIHQTRMSPTIHQQRSSPNQQIQRSSPNQQIQRSSPKQQIQRSLPNQQIQSSSPNQHYQPMNPTIHQPRVSPPIHQQRSSPNQQYQPMNPSIHQPRMSPPIHQQRSSPNQHYQPMNPSIHQPRMSPPIHQVSNQLVQRTSPNMMMQARSPLQGTQPISALATMTSMLQYRPPVQYRPRISPPLPHQQQLQRFPCQTVHCYTNNQSITNIAQAPIQYESQITKHQQVPYQPRNSSATLPQANPAMNSMVQGNMQYQPQQVQTIQANTQYYASAVQNNTQYEIGTPAIQVQYQESTQVTAQYQPVIVQQTRSVTQSMSQVPQSLQQMTHPIQQITQPLQQVTQPIQQMSHIQQIHQPILQMAQSTQQMHQSNQQMAQSNQQIHQPIQQMSQFNQQIHQRNQQMAQSTQQMHQSNQQMHQSNQQMHQSTQQMSQPNQQISQPNQQMSQPNQQIPQLIPQMPELVKVRSTRTQQSTQYSSKQSAYQNTVPQVRLPPPAYEVRYPTTTVSNQSNLGFQQGSNTTTNLQNLGFPQSTMGLNLTVTPNSYDMGSSSIIESQQNSNVNQLGNNPSSSSIPGSLGFQQASTGINTTIITNEQGVTQNTVSRSAIQHNEQKRLMQQIEQLRKNHYKVHAKFLDIEVQKREISILDVHKEQNCEGINTCIAEKIKEAEQVEMAINNLENAPQHITTDQIDAAISKIIQKQLAIYSSVNKLTIDLDGIIKHLQNNNNQVCNNMQVVQNISVPNAANVNNPAVLLNDSHNKASSSNNEDDIKIKHINQVEHVYATLKDTLDNNLNFNLIEMQKIVSIKYMRASTLNSISSQIKEQKAYLEIMKNYIKKLSDRKRAITLGVFLEDIASINAKQVKIAQIQKEILTLQEAIFKTHNSINPELLKKCTLVIQKYQLLQQRAAMLADHRINFIKDPSIASNNKNLIDNIGSLLAENRKTNETLHLEFQTYAKLIQLPNSDISLLENSYRYIIALLSQISSNLDTLRNMQHQITPIPNQGEKSTCIVLPNNQHNNVMPDISLQQIQNNRSNIDSIIREELEAPVNTIAQNLEVNDRDIFLPPSADPERVNILVSIPKDIEYANSEAVNQIISIAVNSNETSRLVNPSTGLMESRLSPMIIDIQDESPEVQEVRTDSQESEEMEGDFVIARPTCKCTQCDKTFTDYLKLITHYADHEFAVKGKKNHCTKNKNESSQLYKCHFCYAEFKTLNTIESHIISHLGIKPFHCHLCRKEFQKKAYLMKHILTHKVEKSFPCDICGKKYTAASSLRIHKLNIHKVPDIPCPYCPEMFMNVSRMKYHIKTKHNLIEKTRKRSGENKSQRVYKRRHSGSNIHRNTPIRRYSGSDIPQETSIRRHSEETPEENSVSHSSNTPSNAVEDNTPQNDFVNNNFGDSMVQTRRKSAENIPVEATARRTSVEKEVQNKRRHSDEVKSQDLKIRRVSGGNVSNEKHHSSNNSTTITSCNISDKRPQETSVSCGATLPQVSHILQSNTTHKSIENITSKSTGSESVIRSMPLLESSHKENNIATKSCSVVIEKPAKKQYYKKKEKKSNERPNLDTNLVFKLGEHKCEYCPEDSPSVFSNASGLKNHIWTRHSQFKDQHKCDTCEMNFKSLSALMIHNKIHDRESSSGGETSLQIENQTISSEINTKSSTDREIEQRRVSEDTEVLITIPENSNSSTSKSNQHTATMSAVSKTSSKSLPVTSKTSDISRNAPSSSKSLPITSKTSDMTKSTSKYRENTHTRSEHKSTSAKTSSSNLKSQNISDKTSNSSKSKECATKTHSSSNSVSHRSKTHDDTARSNKTESGSNTLSRFKTQENSAKKIDVGSKSKLQEISKEKIENVTPNCSKTQDNVSTKFDNTANTLKSGRNSTANSDAFEKYKNTPSCSKTIVKNKEETSTNENLPSTSKSSYSDKINTTSSNENFSSPEIIAIKTINKCDKKLVGKTCLSCTEIGCTYKTIKKSKLDLHKEKHKFQEFKKKFQLRVDNADHPCMLCDLDFNEDESLQIHLKREHPSYVYGCHGCEMRFANEVEYVEHVKVHEPNGKFVCDICDEGFRTEIRLEKHNKFHHKNSK